MSRTGFSIRKLIDQRRRSSDSDNDNDEEAFECSSAKTIRMQYELEQYQIQQLQKEGHAQRRHCSSSMNNNNNNNLTPKKTQRKVPTPITVVRHASVDVMPQSGSASRRTSTPLPASARSHTGLFNPEIPHSQTSNGILRPICSDDHIHQSHHEYRQQLNVPRRSASCLNPNRGSPQHPRSTPSDLSSPSQVPSPSRPRKMSSEKSSSVHNTTMYMPNPGLRNGGHRIHSPQQHTPTTTQHRRAHIKSPSLGTPTDIIFNPSSTSSSALSSRNRQKAAFVNGQPSPPLESEDEYRVDLRAITPEPQFSIDGESTWFLGEGDEEQLAVTDNVQQLICDTDKAFRAVCSALKNARQAQAPHLKHFQPASQTLQTKMIGDDVPLLQTLSDGPYQDPTPSPHSQLISPMSPTAGAGRGTVTSARKSNKSSSLSSSTQIRRAPTQSSISKSKRGSKSPVSKRFESHDSSPSRSIATGSPSKGHRNQHSYQRSLTRLNLAADKVTDRLFEGRAGRFGFHKIEADEVITPSQIQLFRQTRLAKAQAQAEARAKRTTSNETLRSVAGSVGDGNSSDIVATNITENAPDEQSSAKVNVLPSVVKMSPDPLSGLNKDVTCPNPIIAEVETPTDTKEFNIGQSPLATPPATPPQVPATFSSQTTNTDEDESMRLKSIGFHKLSSRRATHTRGNSSLSHIPPLPTIPEVRITAPRVNDNSRQSLQQGRYTPEHNGENPATATEANGRLYFDEDDEHMFFVSTSSTATMPSFQHGRIRLAKADLVNAGTINSLESKLLSSPDEPLDWTAFQMAILGGAGDLFSDPDNFLSRDAQEEMVDDLCDWFEDLGFSNQNLGALATKDTDSSAATTPTTPLYHIRAQMTSTPGSTNRAFYDPSHDQQYNSRPFSSASATSHALLDEAQKMVQIQSMPIPITSEHPSGFWNTQPFDASRFFTGSGCVIKRWTLEGHPKRYQGPGIDVNKANVLPRSNSDLGESPKSGRRESTVRASVDSLPQSPMLDLRMTTAVDGSKDFVPMGYNLGHDLGDFLKWESEHVYASGFYGSD